jgi:hypothetical protein
VEAAAGARRLAAIAELVSRRCDQPDERAHWACDFWDVAGAEVAAALGVNHSKASGQMQLSLTLRHRLPKLAALFIDGKVSYRVVSAIAWQTDLVVDDEPAARIDTALAERATSWGRLSDYKLAQAIDLWVDLYDPGALRRTRGRARTRNLEVGERDDACDTTSVWGRLYATDAALLHRRLMQMAHGVCDDDARTIAQRRADALGALAAGADTLACTCNNARCPAARNDGRASTVLIHVLTDEKALHANPDALMNGQIHTRDPEPEPPPHAPKPPAGLILSGGIVAFPAAGRADRLRRHRAQHRQTRARTRIALPALGRAAGIHPPARPHLPLPRLRTVRRILRHRPHHRLPHRTHPRLQPQMPMPKTPPTQNILDR